ncbi:MAG: alpha/beta family hydrolase [Burkholderiaceae bacterium]|nr:alpha/beta family hydrolase [Burkholderiaceae bacterium]
MQLAGDLVLPTDALGLVVFAHGSGSSRHSPRNRFVAEVLQSRGLATLLLDLLTETEAGDRRHVFDIPLLARRLAEAINACHAELPLQSLRLGLFGASTGAAAALVAAAAQPDRVAAVVSRGGRPDLAGSALPKVRAPTLLIVGGADDIVLQLNRAALSDLTCHAQLHVVPGATHLFEEPGTLEAVAALAADWFVRYLGRRAGVPDEQGTR